MTPQLRAWAALAEAQVGFPEPTQQLTTLYTIVPGDPRPSSGLKGLCRHVVQAFVQAKHLCTLQTGKFIFKND